MTWQRTECKYNGIYVLPHAGGWLLAGWHFTGGYLLKRHMEFLLRGLSRRNARVAVHRSALYRGLSIHTCGLINKHSCWNLKKRT